MRSRIEMMGCQIDNLSMEETLQTIETFIQTGRPHQHVVINVDKLVKASRDDKLRRIINDCQLINVDGMPVVWASRLLGKPLKERVAGVDLFESLMRRSAEKGWRVYLLGARQEVVSAGAQVCTGKYPGLTTVMAIGSQRKRQRSWSALKPRRRTYCSLRSVRQKKSIFLAVTRQR